MCNFCSLIYTSITFDGYHKTSVMINMAVFEALSRTHLNLMNAFLWTTLICCIIFSFSRSLFSHSKLIDQFGLDSKFVLKQIELKKMMKLENEKNIYNNRNLFFYGICLSKSHSIHWLFGFRSFLIFPPVDWTCITLTSTGMSVSELTHSLQTT